MADFVGWAGRVTNLASSEHPPEGLRFGDFDGDKLTDVFVTSSGQWQYSPAGRGTWVKLTTSSVSIGALDFGDFDRSGTTDVFTSSSGQWMYSMGGVSQ